MPQKWTPDEALALYRSPFFELFDRARATHRTHHPAPYIQKATLLSVKTGRCQEDCAYCPQSAHYETDVEAHSLMKCGDVLEKAREAKEAGASRFCMGAAWRNAPQGAEFDSVLEMVRGVRGLGMEACLTAGMLTSDQAAKLKEAGLTAYNHNLDSSESFYKKIITTRTYRDRLNTISAVQDAGLSLCCGGIIGMGETDLDRCTMLATLSGLDPQPESVPINSLVPVEGTPLEGQGLEDPMDMVRTVAVARILMPRAMVRLSAGRDEMSPELQTLCFLVGANSVFLGQKLLTTKNSSLERDLRMFESLGMKGRELNA